MNERIKAHVEQLFLGSAHTRQAADVKEELLANLQAKYEDMLNSGKSEDEAFNSAVSGIGDIRSLLGETPQYDTHQVSVKRQTSGVLKAVAITIMIFSIIPTIVLSEIFGNTWLEFLAPITFLSVIAVGVGILIYAFSIGPKKYVKGDDTFVEEYKEKVSGNNRDARLKRAVSSTLWTAIVALYFILSFMTGAWHVTWMIFIIGALVQNIIRFSYGDQKGYNKLISSTIWISALLIYLFVSFTTYYWAWTWIIFIVALLVNQLIKLFVIWREEE